MTAAKGVPGSPRRPGSDDNCSATAALMLGARPFLELSKQGKLDCDVWLVHLTGEEYPAEGLGTCRMCQWLVEGTMSCTLAMASSTTVRRPHQGVYVLDMIANNNNYDRDVFQIAPGASAESLWLAEQAHEAAEAWNLSALAWNRQPSRSAGRATQPRRPIDPRAGQVSAAA